MKIFLIFQIHTRTGIKLYINHRTIALYIAFKIRVLGFRITQTLAAVTAIQYTLI